MPNCEHNSKAVATSEDSQLPTSRIRGGVSLDMLGFLLNQRECRELNYLLRKELDEMLYDLKDNRLDEEVKKAIEARYKVVFRMYARLAPSKDLSRYARNRQYQ